ncbi:MAG: Na+-transporting methylmalonyl-CoA/oxaloacetate decarboxylase beta subunit [Clostridium sp.]
MGAMAKVEVFLKKETLFIVWLGMAAFCIITAAGVIGIAIKRIFF